MELKIRLGRKKQLAKTPAPKVDTQTGSAVSRMTKLYEKYAINTEKYTAADFEKMRQTDGTFMALTNLMTLPILATHWDIIPDDENDPDGTQAKDVENALKRPPERGGMSTPFHLVMAEMLRATTEGFRYFEKVYTVSPEGKIVYKKLAGYPSESITILTDDKGGFDGVEQRINPGEDPVRIPVEKSFLYTHGKEKNWLKGESSFIAAAYHYKEKHDLYYLGKLQAQSGSIPPRVAQASEKAKQDVMDTVAEQLSDLVELNAAVVLPFGFEMQSMGSTNKVDILPLINHHNMEMTRSLLAHAIMLGDGASGSWALSKDQTDLLNLVLQGIMTNVEYHINAFILPDLTEFNYAKPSYPQFKFAELTDATLGVLETAFTSIIGAKPEALTDEFVGSVIQKMALQLGIDLEDIKPDTTGTIENSKKGGSEKRRFLAGDQKWRRPLSEAEKKVNLDGLEKKQNTLGEGLNDDTEQLYSELAENIQADVQALIDDGKLDEALAYTIPQEDRDAYQKLIEDTMTDAFNYAKTGAANEIEVSAPATSQAQKDIISAQAKAIVDDQFGQIETNVRRIVTDQAKRNELSVELNLEETIAAIIAFITGFWTNNVKPGNSFIVSDAVNIGRNFVFEESADEIDRYEYSAILDIATCETCLGLDGKVVSPEDYKKTKFKPPIHFHCRCIWIAIRKAEQEKPEITGIDDIIGGRSASDFVPA
jgi:hypothetical protein